MCDLFIIVKSALVSNSQGFLMTEKRKTDIKMISFRGSDIVGLKGGLIFMSKESIVKELFWNIVEISEPFRPSGEEYEEARKRKDEAEAKLIAILPEGGVKIFEEFMEAVGDVEVLEEEEIYSQGFYFGLQLTTEAYTKNKNRVVKSIFE